MFGKKQDETNVDEAIPPDLNGELKAFSIKLMFSFLFRANESSHPFDLKENYMSLLSKGLTKEDIIEIISDIGFRRMFNLKDGDLVEVTYEK